MFSPMMAARTDYAKLELFALCTGPGHDAQN
jgi:hypothetical protein